MSIKKEDLYILTTAALLHDVGKFFQKVGYTPMELKNFMNNRKDIFNGKKYHHYIGSALIEDVIDELKEEEKNQERIKNLRK